MERSVTRQRKLPAFSLNVADVDVLLAKLESLFPSKPVVRISLDLPKSEKLVFENTEEIRQYQFLRGQVTKLTLSCTSNSPFNKVTISTSYFSGIGSISADSDNEAWCAGAVETGHSFLQSYKPWYSFAYSSLIGPIYFVMILAAILSSVLKLEPVPPWAAITYLCVLIPVSVIYLSREHLFPAVILRITEEPSFIRRYQVELGLLVAVISMILGAFALFTSK